MANDGTLPLGSSVDDGATLPFVIEEATGNERVKVTLDNHDAPMGAPRHHGGFSLGGKNEKHKIYLDGRSGPIIHTRYTVWKPVVIKGHLRDTLEGAGGGTYYGRAQQLVKDLNTILGNQRELKLSCGPYEWRAHADDFDLPVEGLSDFTYELRFDVLKRPGEKPPTDTRGGLLEPFPYDLTAQAAALLVADKAALLAQQIFVNIQIVIATMLDGIGTTLGDTLSAAQAFENAADGSTAEASTLSARAQQAGASCATAIATLSTISAASALPTTAQDATASFEAAMYATMMDIYSVQQDMQRVQYTAKQAIRSTTRVYRVAPGDTLESIATSQLGTPARARDLGYRTQDLVAGKLIRIPA